MDYITTETTITRRHINTVIVIHNVTWGKMADTFNNTTNTLFYILR